uniref:Uncharacterized protein n=1 Tax=Pyricularia oryzae (strain P131) TaxID=1143193 RepID=L7J960_PYRO1
MVSKGVVITYKRVGYNSQDFKFLNRIADD